MTTLSGDKSGMRIIQNILGMRTYHLKFSDRKRARHITSSTAKEAILSARKDILAISISSWSDDNSSATFDAAIQTGQTRHGAAPFTNISVYVTIE